MLRRMSYRAFLGAASGSGGARLRRAGAGAVQGRAGKRVVRGGGRGDRLPADARERLARPALGEGRSVPEPVEELHLLLAVRAQRMVVRKILDQLTHAGAELVREVWSRGADEGIDVVARRLG